MKKAALRLLAGALMLFAAGSSMFACVWWLHQPETPESLIR